MASEALEVREVCAESEEVEVLPVEAALDLVTGPAEAGAVLEVSQVWGETLVDTRHFAPGHEEEVSAGASLGWRWRALGTDLGWVGEPWRHLAALVPLSELSQEPRQAFWIPGRERDLARWEDGRFVALVDEGARVLVDGAELSPAEAGAKGLATAEGACWAVPLVEGVAVLQIAGGSVFAIRSVRAAKRVERSRTRVEPALAGLLGAVAALALGLVVVVAASPPPDHSSAPELSEHLTGMIMSVPDREEQEEEVEEEAEPERPEREVQREERTRKPKTKRDDDVAQAQEDREVVDGAGVFAAFGSGEGLDGLTGTGLDPSLVGAVSGLIGAKGAFLRIGLNSRGSSLGGGGQADGIGSLDPRCQGADCYAITESGDGIIGSKEEPEITQGKDAIVIGNIDRAQVDEEVRRNLSRIRYCYQRQLPQTPDLTGKVVVKFVIAANGTVSTAEVKTSSLGAQPVEACVVRRFYSMQFPELRGGGMAVVSYPFLFAPG